VKEGDGWSLGNKIALAGVIVAVIGLISGWQISSNSGGGGRHKTSSSSSNTPSPTPTPSQPSTSPAKPAFLSSLTPSAGDQPGKGDIQLAGADFPHSIFYEDIAGDLSSAHACDSVPSGFDCRATSYDLGGRYRRLTASFGLTQGGNPAFNAEGRWEISVDDQVIKQGVEPANKTPTPIDVPLGSGHVLVLRAAVDEAIGDTSTVAWGNARIR
jgi:hypothetical protein